MHIVEAVTEDGTRIELRSDGTWSPIGPPPDEIQPKEGFRKASWGASREDIQLVEVGEYDVDTPELLVIPARVGELNFNAVYILLGDQLVRAKYMLTETYQNKNHYLNAYETLKQSLAKKYGQTRSDDTYWSNDLYKDDHQDWGMAVSCGHLMQSATWQTTETDVLLTLDGEGFEVRVGIQYTGRRLSSLEASHQEARLLEDL